MGHKFMLLPVVKLLLKFYSYYMSFILYCFPHLPNSNYKSTHPCCNAAQKLKMRWTSTMKISSRGSHCPLDWLPMGLDCFVAAQRESRYSLRCKCWYFLCSSVSAWNCQCSTSPGVFSRYHIYIFPREEGSLLCLRLTQRVTPTSTTRLYRDYVH
jgi:hypothetical protein